MFLEFLDEHRVLVANVDVAGIDAQFNALSFYRRCQFLVDALDAYYLLPREAPLWQQNGAIATYLICLQRVAAWVTFDEFVGKFTEPTLQMQLLYILTVIHASSLSSSVFVQLMDGTIQTFVNDDRFAKLHGSDVKDKMLASRIGATRSGHRILALCCALKDEFWRFRGDVEAANVAVRFLKICEQLPVELLQQIVLMAHPRAYGLHKLQDVATMWAVGAPFWP